MAGKSYKRFSHGKDYSEMALLYMKQITEKDIAYDEDTVADSYDLGYVRRAGQEVMTARDAYYEWMDKVVEMGEDYKHWMWNSSIRGRGRYRVADEILHKLGALRLLEPGVGALSKIARDRRELHLLEVKVLDGQELVGAGHLEVLPALSAFALRRDKLSAELYDPVAEVMGNFMKVTLKVGVKCFVC